MAETLAVSEVFGPTVQGEGPFAGRRCAFLRLARCNLDCTWCLDPETPVLMADWTERKLGDLVAGDHVMSFRRRQFEVAVVQSTYRRWADERLRVLAAGREVVTTPDHIFANPHNKDNRRRSRADDLVGRHVRMATAIDSPEVDRDDEWWLGWGKGLIAGDGHISGLVRRPDRPSPGGPRVYLQITDRELAEAYSELVNLHGARTNVTISSRLTVTGRKVYRVSHSLRPVAWVADLPSGDRQVRGWLAGFFDAEGSTGRSQLQISQYEPKTLDRVQAMLDGLGIPHTRAKVTVMINGGANCNRFFNATRPLLDRKTHKIRNDPRRMLRAAKVRVEPAESGEVCNLTTSSGFFFAAGMLVEQCDSSWTWDWKGKNGIVYDPAVEVKRMPVAEVADKLAAIGCDRIVITGGEPLLQRSKLRWLIELLPGRRFEIETNGTIAPDALGRIVDHFSVSPKLASSGVSRDRAWNLDALREFDAAAQLWRLSVAFKFVCCGVEDLDEVDELVALVPLRPETVWIMPQGRDAATIEKGLGNLADEAIGRGYNLSGRLHVSTWGDERGR